MTTRQRVFIVACGVLAIDLRRLVEKVDLEVGMRFLPGGLHEDPNRLRDQVQAAIDEVSDTGRWERIAVGYGICGRGTVGLKTRRLPVAIPRVHDCIAMFLGSDARYREEFHRFPGTYYVSAGWHAEKSEPLRQKSPKAWMGDRQVTYDELVEKYGEESARDTFHFLSSWQRNYQRAAYIDTGGGDDNRVAAYAREMAERYGWRYEALEGDLHLLERLLTSTTSNDEILVAPPDHVTIYDSRERGLAARPVMDPGLRAAEVPTRAAADTPAPRKPPADRRLLDLGLGIDAGGTYTDAVIYDLAQGRVLGKHKALTTRWDFTVGIREALGGLDPAHLARVEMVALSTTLATNAIVEGEGQKVGLLFMPPYGLFEPGDIPHEPKALMAGRLEISGEVRQAVDADEVRRTAREMVDRHGVEAFAVSGYAGSINPEHELMVKHLLQEETGFFVTCGHELSQLLNFRTRARTAVLNARIVPRLVRLLQDLEKVLTDVDVRAPVMVVKGDGSLMSRTMAMERPVETILSGPAASVAGARFLTGRTDAVVVDMGGTTTDTASVAEGAVRVCEQGSQVGDHQTHVRALEIRTCGLGGDSHIALDKGAFTVGPRRVAPMAWLGARGGAAVADTLAFMEQRLHRFSGSSAPLQVFTLTGRAPDLEVSDLESQVLGLLAGRPRSLDELVLRTGAIYAGALPLTRLEERFVIQRCGLTPTDLLHVTGHFQRWDTATARRMAELLAALAGVEVDRLVTDTLDMVVERLAREVFKKLLDADTQADDLDTCRVCQTLWVNLRKGGNAQFRLRLEMKPPVIGIGAPVGHFLPQAAELLGAEAILPPDADVANAIGAITSHIAVRREVTIRPDHSGGFTLEGLAGAPRFEKFPEADTFARQALTEKVRLIARRAGTSETHIDLEVDDRTVRTAAGDVLFLERILTARLSGQPDMVVAPEASRERGATAAG